MNKPDCNGTTPRQIETSPTKTACIYVSSIILVVTVLSSLSLLRFIISICHYEYTTGRTVCSPQNVLLERLPIEIPSRTIFLRIGGSEYFDSIEVFNASKHEHHEEWEKGSTIEHSLTLLDASNFSRFKNLKELTLFRCGVEQINEHTFANLTKLKKLSLRNNRLIWIQERAFSGLWNLSLLDLSNNPLLTLGNRLFSGSTFVTLTLEGMGNLTLIENETFDNTTLDNLIISGASMSAISRSSFDELWKSLKTLTFVDNSRKLTIDDETFENFELLSILNLTNSSLSQVSFLGLSDVSTIILDLNTFDNDTFQFANEREYFIGTKYLSISGANLSKVPEEISKIYKRLETLILSKNNIASISAEDFCDMNELIFLDLSHNKISIINGNIVEQLLQLSRFQLHSNLLSALPQELDAFFYKLQAVTISGNPFHCNCNLKWFSDWLKTSNFSSNIFEDVDLVNCSVPENVNILKAGRNAFLCYEPTIEKQFFTEPADGDLITLECSIKGDPLPIIIWERLLNERDLANILVDEAIPTIIPEELRKPIDVNTTHRVEQYSSTGLYVAHSTLSISLPGNFTCIGRNSMGSVNHTFDTNLLPITKKHFKAENLEKIQLLASFEGAVVAVTLLLIIGYLLKGES